MPRWKVVDTLGDVGAFLRRRDRYDHTEQTKPVHLCSFSRVPSRNTYLGPMFVRSRMIRHIGWTSGGEYEHARSCTAARFFTTLGLINNLFYFLCTTAVRTRTRVHCFTCDLDFRNLCWSLSSHTRPTHTPTHHYLQDASPNNTAVAGVSNRYNIRSTAQGNMHEPLKYALSKAISGIGVRHDAERGTHFTGEPNRA